MNVFTSEVEMLRAECKEWEKVCNQHLRHINKLKKKLDEAFCDGFKAGFKESGEGFNGECGASNQEVDVVCKEALKERKK